MKKVIICGLRDMDLLRSIEYFLEDDCEIIGYYHVWSRTINPLQKHEFYSIDQLKSLTFDYLILATFDANHLAKLIEQLSALDCNEKIVIPIILKANSCEKTKVDTVRQIDICDGEYYGVVMGLSHAIRGINFSVLKKRMFNLSAWGYDMYYNLRLFQYALRVGKFTDIKEAWLVFPYYYFDYDQSQSYHQYHVGQIFGVHRLNDWHNAHKVTKNSDITGGGVRNYIANYRLFGRKMTDHYQFEFEPTQSLGVYKGASKKCSLLKSFWRDRPATIDENRAVFRELITVLTERDVITTLIPPPLCIDALDNKNLQRLDVLKERFYSIANEELKKLGMYVKIKDCTQLFADKRQLFLDVVHLNTPGAIEFSKFLNGEFLH